MHQQQRLAIKVPIEGLRRDDKPVEDRAVVVTDVQYRDCRGLDRSLTDRVLSACACDWRLQRV